MKISQVLLQLLYLSTASFAHDMVEDDHGRRTMSNYLRQLGDGDGKKNDNDNLKCTDYNINGELILKNSAVFRSSRIDQISSSTQCVNISTFAGGALGASFCSGDTFSIGATPFFFGNDDEESDDDDEMLGYYTRSGMRVHYLYLMTEKKEVPFWSAMRSSNAFVFKNKDQLHFQGVDQAGAPTLVTAIAGGTGKANTCVRGVQSPLRASFSRWIISLQCAWFQSQSE